MAKRKPDPPHPNTQLVQAFEVFGYVSGEFLPASLGSSVQVKLDYTNVSGMTGETRLAMDTATAINLAKKIAEIVFTLEPNGVAE